jgi:hypothetical protein
MRQDDSANPFEKGDALKNKNFGKYWIQILSATLVLVVIIFFMFWLFRK